MIIHQESSSAQKDDIEAVHLDHDTGDKATNATEAVDTARNGSHGRANRASSASLGGNTAHARGEGRAQLETRGRSRDGQEKGGLEHPAIAQIVKFNFRFHLNQTTLPSRHFAAVFCHACSMLINLLPLVGQQGRSLWELRIHG